MSHATESKKDVVNNGRLADAGDRLSEDLNTLKSNFSDLKGDVSRILGHLADAGRAGKDVAAGQAYRAVDATREKVHDAMGVVKDKAHDAQEYSKDALDELAKQIRANPGTATLIAFGVGFIASRLMSHRR